MIPLTGGNLPGDYFRILLLEEDPVDADLIERSFKQASGKFPIQHVTTINETLRQSANSDLLLFSLSRNITLELLAKIRAACPWIPVVVMEMRIRIPDQRRLRRSCSGSERHHTEGSSGDEGEGHFAKHVFTPFAP